jgi:pimeloyl-ACP methyl ester carboxylesterase
MRGLGKVPEVVIGHSFGAKVALAYARDQRPPGLKQVIVLDAVPGTPTEPQTVENNQVLQVIAAIRRTSLPAVDRREVKAQLSAQGIPSSIVEWLATSLRRGDDGWRWCFDIEAVAEMMRSYFAADFWHYLRTLGEEPRVVFIRASRSDRWSETELAGFADTRAKLHVLAEAGHWLHVDNPAGLGLQLAGLLGDR